MFIENVGQFDHPRVDQSGEVEAGDIQALVAQWRKGC